MKVARSWRWALGLHGLAVLLYLYLPMAVVVMQSFNDAKYSPRWQGFTLRWYVALWHDRELGGVVLNTLIVASVPTLIATVLGTLLAIGLRRYRFRLQSAVDQVLLVPVFLPDVVMGVSLLLFFGWLRGWLGWPDLGLGTIILGHVSYQIAYVALVVQSRLVTLDPAIEEAARDLGANSWRCFWLVQLPQLAPAVGAAALLAFTLSIDDFAITYFTNGPGSTTLPIYIYSSVKKGISPSIHALSTLMMLASAIGIVVGGLLLKRKPA
jgi:spermidine/putrescine transport system permease protein